MKSRMLCAAAAIVILLCPAMVDAKRHKHPAAAANHQPNVFGKVMSGSRPVRAKVSLHPQRRRSPMLHPHVSSTAQFQAHVNPGTWVASARRHGVGRGSVAFHIDQGNTMNIVVPLARKHHRIRMSRRHRLGMHVRPAPKSSPAPKPAANPAPKPAAAAAPAPTKPKTVVGKR